MLPESDLDVQQTHLRFYNFLVKIWAQFVEHLGLTWAAHKSVTKFTSTIVVNLVTHKL